MPLPEEKPNALQLEALADNVAYCKMVNALKAEIEPAARAWMTKSFPGAKLFDNRVASLTQLMAAIVYQEREGKLGQFVSNIAEPATTAPAPVEALHEAQATIAMLTKELCKIADVDFSNGTEAFTNARHRVMGVLASLSSPKAVEADMSKPDIPYFKTGRFIDPDPSPMG